MQSRTDTLSLSCCRHARHTSSQGLQRAGRRLRLMKVGSLTIKWRAALLGDLWAENYRAKPDAVT